ncbi:MAG: excinuclease ABC subunit UvrA, partial [bacterium]|nr:excinuclease ABC subunit UvrA [bacterium]
MSYDYIRIKGAKEHNLKNISLDLPRNKFIVITGLSGSGKSTLAFDTIYAEGQRRYVESLSAYARQFLGQMEKPDVESIEGLSPSISIEQKVTHRNPRSIVATVTEIYDYFRLLFANAGEPTCYLCGKPITSQTSTQIIDYVLKYPPPAKVQVLAPLVTGRKGEYKNVIETVRKEGFARIRIDGKVYNLHEDRIPDLKKSLKHTLEIVVDRLVIKPGDEKRISDSVESGLRHGDGKVIIKDENEERIFSRKLACTDCGVSLPEISPRFFSFNNPYGACPTCSGLGKAIEFDPDLIVPDPNLSIYEGAIDPFQIQGRNYFYHTFKGLAETYHFSLDTPFRKLPQKVKEIIFYGTGGKKIRFNYESDRFKGSYDGRFEGVINNLKRRYRDTQSEEMREEISGYMSTKLCPDCGGHRLKKEVLAVKIKGHSIMDVTRMSVKECYGFFDSIRLTENQKLIARDILKEIKERLQFLLNVGLDYLTLDREAGTLSGGEAQRIRLATQVGSGLVGVLYVLDEPSIGLHQKDNRKLLDTLRHLNRIGNTLLVIEHDEETIRNADYVVDLGPGAGEHGGLVVAVGTPEEIEKNPDSITGQYLSGRLKVDVPLKRRKGNGKVL